MSKPQNEWTDDEWVAAEAIVLKCIQRREMSPADAYLELVRLGMHEGYAKGMLNLPPSYAPPLEGTK